MTDIAIAVMTRVLMLVAWKHNQEIATKNVKSLCEFIESGGI